jgi:hypothetical protein
MTLVVLPAACAQGLNDLGGDSAGTGGSGAGGPTSSSAGSTVGSTGASSAVSSTSATSGSTGGGGGATSSSSAVSSSSSSSGGGGNGGSGGAGGGNSGGGGAGGGPVGCPMAPTNLMGCAGCGAFCDSPWPASWSPVPGATHYIVEYSCFVANQYQTVNSSVDLCTEVGMCNNNLCANGAGPVTVKACDANCCSPPVTVPVAETPIACGGGICC